MFASWLCFVSSFSLLGNKALQVDEIHPEMFKAVEIFDVAHMLLYSVVKTGDNVLGPEDLCSCPCLV